jgi:hypothetical protein
LKISPEDKLKFNICKKVDTDCRDDSGFATSEKECTNYSNSTNSQKKWTICNNILNNFNYYLFLL